MTPMAGVDESEQERFSRFAAAARPRLRQALVAWYGVDIGSDVTADALAYAWERWDDIEPMENPVGYLFRVAQSKSRRYRRRAVGFPAVAPAELPDIDPRLPGALAQLSHQQRAAVLLVHAHGWSQTEAAAALGCSVSTLRNHLDRGLRRLRAALGDDDA